MADILSSTFTTPIAITTKQPHLFASQDLVKVTGHTVNTSANGEWTITVTSATTFTLLGSAGIAVGGATGEAYDQGPQRSFTSPPAEPTSTDRLWNAFRKLVRLELPRLTFLGMYSYVLQFIDGSGNLHMVPNEPKYGLTWPPLTATPNSGLPPLVLPPSVLQPSILGEQITLTVGQHLVIAFLNGDPTRPMVIGSDPTTPPTKATVDATTELDLGPSAPTVKIAGGTLPVARQTDTVVAGIFAGTITGGSPKVGSG